MLPAGSLLGQIPIVLPDENLGPEQIAALRRMTPEEHLRIGRTLYWSARRLKAAFLRDQHPDWSDEQIDRDVSPCPILI